jgi:hypothetical protein
MGLIHIYSIDIVVLIHRIHIYTIDRVGFIVYTTYRCEGAALSTLQQDRRLQHMLLMLSDQLCFVETLQHIAPVWQTVARCLGLVRILLVLLVAHFDDLQLLLELEDLSLQTELVARGEV